ncbi:MAG: FMN-binding protein [Clostridia bacterium]|nr:FMN-binding protein [Clostridia bacterium]
METKSVKNILLVGLKLLLICAVVAGVVSFVYAVTESDYQKNLDTTKREAVEAIFGETGLDLYELGEDIYEVKKSGKLLGYSAKGTGIGFGGEIEMMVGYDATFSIKGISVISHSETPGIGATLLEENKTYFEAYMGQSGEDVDADAYSGATYTSKGVKAAVKEATERLIAALGK